MAKTLTTTNPRPTEIRKGLIEHTVLCMFVKVLNEQRQVSSFLTFVEKLDIEINSLSVYTTRASALKGKKKTVKLKNMIWHSYYSEKYFYKYPKRVRISKETWNETCTVMLFKTLSKRSTTTV